MVSVTPEARSVDITEYGALLRRLDWHAGDLRKIDARIGDLTDAQDTAAGLCAHADPLDALERRRDQVADAALWVVDRLHADGFFEDLAKEFDEAVADLRRAVEAPDA